MLQSIDVPTADGVADSYFARPDDARHPGVLLISDAFGLRPRIGEMAERIAEQGYTVLAPNIFYRSGRAPLFEMPDLTVSENRASFFALLAPIRDQLTPERVLADIDCYLTFLSADPHTEQGPAGVTGYCMGGRLVLRAAGAFGDRIAAVGVFHSGRLTELDDAPIHTVGGIRAEVLLAYADNDEGAQPHHIAALDQALAQADVRSTSVVYTGAPHGYTMTDTAMHHAEGEQRHWHDLFGLLSRTLRG
jgi:carboxymethylenebutenolidase